MAKTDHLRSRRSAAELHALASVEREIRATDPTVGRKYLRNYRDAFSSYRRVLTAADVSAAVAHANTALIGDYHALPGSQRYFASLIRDCKSHGRPLVVGLETIFSRDQHIVDEWLRGEIEESELRQRIRFDLDWGYDWAPFYELLMAARDHGIWLYGLDCMPREDLRKIGARDRHAADKITEIRARHPEALVLVLFGESHLAPSHLPQQVRGRLPEEKLLTVLQNVDALYWRAAGEAADRVEAVEVRDDVVCVFTATPLEKYENYRLCLDRWGRDGAPDLAPTVYNLIESLIRVLSINQYSPHNTTQPRLLVDLMPEVYTRSSDTLLRRMLSRKHFRGELRRSLLESVKRRGSLYLAPLNAVYIRRFEIASAAEDASRFLHHACRGLPSRINGKATAVLAPEDAFFAAVLEHALAYFGSRVIYPARAPFRDADLLELYELTHEDLEKQTSVSYPEVMESLDFLSWHRQTGRSRPAGPDWSRAFAFTGRKWDYVTELLGRLVGNDLYDAYMDGSLGAGALRRLFVAHIEEPGAAPEVYANLNARLR